VGSKLPWKFRTLNPEVTAHPGEQKKVVYVAKNVSGRDMQGMAKFNISPAEAGRYFRKTQCFCFSNQKLKNGEEKEMSLVFVIDPRLPKRVKNIVLTYEFVNTGKKMAGNSKK
jgi:cytochrome c oxidase assembly protein subunit 11